MLLLFIDVDEIDGQTGADSIGDEIEPELSSLRKSIVSRLKTSAPKEEKKVRSCDCHVTT